MRGKRVWATGAAKKAKSSAEKSPSAQAGMRCAQRKKRCIVLLGAFSLPKRLSWSRGASFRCSSMRYAAPCASAGGAGESVNRCPSGKICHRRGGIFRTRGRTRLPVPARNFCSSFFHSSFCVKNKKRALCREHALQIRIPDCCHTISQDTRKKRYKNCLVCILCLIYEIVWQK